MTEINISAAAPQCPHCKYFVPGTADKPGGKCQITMCSIGDERQDYEDDQSCGPDGLWFLPRADDDEPIAPVEPKPEPEPELKKPRRCSALFAFAMWTVGVLSAFWFLGMLK